MKKNYILRLYIAGLEPDNQTMITDFKEYLSKHLGEDNYSLEVIDVLDRPQLAEEERILATPTVIRKLPKPIKKVILNLNNHLSSVVGLDLIVND